MSKLIDEKQKKRREQGARLQKLRSDAGYDEAADAARAIGVPIPTYQAHENGSRSMVKNAEKYANFYGSDIGYLLRGHGEKLTAQVAGVVGPGTWIDEKNFVQPAHAPIPGSHEFPHLDQGAFVVQPQTDAALTEYVIGVPYWRARASLTNGDLVIGESRVSNLVERRMWRIRITAEHAILEPYKTNGEPQQLPANASRNSDVSPKITHMVVGFWNRPERG